MEKKIYVLTKTENNEQPHLICKFHEKSSPIDLYKYGLRFFEDEIGWYYKSKELVCTLD